jgi:hypothetical protein
VPLDSRAQGAGREGSLFLKNFGDRRPWKLPLPFLPTGDFSTCRRRRSEASASGRSRFPKSPFTALISVTQQSRPPAAPEGAPFSGKERKVSHLQAAEGPRQEPAP